MKILKPHDKYGWVSGISNGRHVSAKVYQIGSTFGINNGRVSKLSILKTDKRDKNANYFDQCDYNYERGLDFDNLPDGLLNKIVADLEALPTDNVEDE